MRFILTLMLQLLFASFSVQAATNYADPLVTPVATLQLKTGDMKLAARHALIKNQWDVEKVSDTSLTGAYNGNRPSKAEVNFSNSDSISVRFLTDHAGDYHFYKRLLNIKKVMMLYLTDCSNPAMKPDILTVDSGVLRRRNLVYALSSYHWNITSITESKLIASIPARGRIEIDISADGVVMIRRWDDMKDSFTNPIQDNYVLRIQKVYDIQQKICRPSP